MRVFVHHGWEVVGAPDDGGIKRSLSNVPVGSTDRMWIEHG